MKNQWNNQESVRFIQKYKRLGYSEDIALRVYTSRLIGLDKSLVLHGGGNTSVKTKMKDIDDIHHDVICVKGSGWDLSNIEPEGLPAVKLSPLLSLQTKKKLSDDEMVAFQKRNLLDTSSPNPSVETFLHAFLPHKYVDHTHSNAILTLTNRPDGMSLCKRIFNRNVRVLPYIMPGFDLALEVNKYIKEHPNINCLILMNHGIFTFCETAKGSYDHMINYVSTAEEYIKNCSGVFKTSDGNILRGKNKSSIKELLPIVRGLVSKNNSYILSFKSNKNILDFMDNKRAKKYMNEGTITPDHVIRIKPFPLFIGREKFKKNIKLKKLLKNEINKYREKYERYFVQNSNKSGTSKIMLDSCPNIIFLQDVGMIAVGKTKKESQIAIDIAEQNISVIKDVEKTSQFKSISKKALFDMEYWSLEQAKLNKVKKELQGKVVAITGGLGKIGFETYKLFKDKGAEVVILDVNRKLIHEFRKQYDDLCIECDVSNKSSVSRSFSKIISELGGLDILVSNAGYAPQGMIAEISDNELRKSFDNNFFAHQNCASIATKIFIDQNIKGCLLFNISKQAVNPGKSFGPYGLPKAALMNLCKQYAIDYGSFGVRSNGVNADRIMSGLLDAKMINERSRARGLTSKEYMQGNLLKSEVFATDVAKAFFHLAVSEKTTGTILTVDGGNIAASFR